MQYTTQDITINPLKTGKGWKEPAYDLKPVYNLRQSISPANTVKKLFYHKVTRTERNNIN